jgi:hypothetical protein
MCRREVFFRQGIRLWTIIVMFFEESKIDTLCLIYFFEERARKDFDGGIRCFAVGARSGLGCFGRLAVAEYDWSLCIQKVYSDLC